jgi:hypothetical protein
MSTKQLKSLTKKQSPRVAAAVKALRIFIERPLKPGKLTSFLDKLAADGCELRHLQDAAAVDDRFAWQQAIDDITDRLCASTTRPLPAEMTCAEVLRRAARAGDEQARALIDAGFDESWVA